MKRKTLLVLLVSICILATGIVFFAIWDLWEEIETINIFRRDFLLSFFLRENDWS